MRIAKRLAALERKAPDTNFAVTLSYGEKPLEEVEAEYNAIHGFNPKREWIHVRFVGIEPNEVKHGDA